MKMVSLTTAGLFILMVGVAEAADWPCWRGPNHNGTTPEPSGYGSGGWPPPETAWTVNVGSGETSPISVQGCVYAMGHADGQDVVRCLNAATGETRWQAAYACKPRGRHARGDQGQYSEGPLSTPTYDAATGDLYTLSCDGHLNCWNTRADGRKLWGVNLYDRFDAPQRPHTGGGVRDYGYTTAPLVHGDWLIVEVGCSEGNLIAFDKATGEIRWASENTSPAGHTGGLIPTTVDGIPCVAVLNLHELLVVRLDTAREGHTLATHPFQARFSCDLVTPAVWRNMVVLATHMGPGNQLVEVTPSGITNRGSCPPTKTGMPIFHNGRLYRAGGALERYDLVDNGFRRVWKGQVLGDEGSLILTGDHKLIAKGRGKLLLYDVDGTKLAERTARGRWPHVTFADGRVLCKDNRGNIDCFVVAATSVVPVAPPAR